MIMKILEKEASQTGEHYYLIMGSGITKFPDLKCNVPSDIYHVDGIRIDAVSAMLYLDFGKQEGEYVPNEVERISTMKRLISFVK